MSGLTESEAKTYWEGLAKTHGERAVGSLNKVMSAQDAICEKRLAWLRGHLDDAVLDQPVIDFGCGIGRYSVLWNDYIGVDISPTMVEMARFRNPAKVFIALPEPWLMPEPMFHFSKVFFTTTVLQHCTDEVALAVFDSVRKEMPSVEKIVLYENIDQNGGFMRGRKPSDYAFLIAEAGLPIENTSFVLRTVEQSNDYALTTVTLCRD